MFPHSLSRRAVVRPHAGLVAVAIGLGSWFCPHSVVAQDDDNDAKTGYLIEVAAPLDGDSANQLLVQLKQLAETVPEGQRATTVIRYTATSDNGSATPFEDALKLARAITQPEFRRIRVVSLLEGEITGHTVLPILASDTLLVFGGSALANATIGESSSDETILLSYQSIAARRGLFPPAVVSALVDPAAELALVSKVGGDRVFASGDELVKLRESGEVLREEIYSAPGVPLRIDAKQLRDSRVAAGIVDSLDQAATELLDLAKLDPVGKRVSSGEAKGALLEISGSISPNRMRRWQSNLSATLESGDVNTWVISIDSSGGDINESATLAGWFAEPDPPLRTVAGLIRGEARGDAALIALACRPLYMKPGSTIGGPGSDDITDDDIDKYDELIEQVARSTKRPAALIRGLLDRELVVYEYKHRKTGRLRYATEDDLADAEDPDLERERWERGEQVDLAAGLTADQAADLGLIDGQSRSLEDTSRRVGLSGTPAQITDRKIVRFVEKLGRSPGLAFILLFIGFVTLSAEANAPGMSVPGFISIVCFGLYFWIKFLAGTAEWLELVLFALGLMCIAIEVFVVPGFGVFGIGGLALTVMGIVLMSQTFVIPRNTYQIEVLARGLWIALGGAAGMIGGFLMMRILFPHVPFLSGLVMEAPNSEVVNEAEKIADFADLAGQMGITTTKLMPSGKARFGDKIVAVVSEGSAVPSGESIRVIEVQGNRIVVEAVNS